MTKSPSTEKKAKALKIAGEKVYPGERKRLSIDLATLYDYTQLAIPIEVIRGKEEGPIMFLSAAIHGDEINGVEIIKKVLKKPVLSKLKGTLIAIPVVNVFGFNNKSRYLPDRRDLNRSFPGAKTGSLASRMAYFLMKEIVSQCTHGIDLHTAAINRNNLPQIRAALEDKETQKLAESFGVPIIINSKLRDGSLREAARKRNVRTLLFEGGEALRFNEDVIKLGVRGCFSFMKQIGMLEVTSLTHSVATAPLRKSKIARGSYWVRAPHSGTFDLKKKLGDRVERNETIAVITDTFGGDPYVVRADEKGLIVGLSTIPLVNQGDAIAHIATFSSQLSSREARFMLDEMI
ncbi:succinylglutamate desuccinylase/aspartoacylase family protein [bacterium]|nr:succinylglutamate desuccinylase/aspartoacylase family protein [bacterium]